MNWELAACSWHDHALVGTDAAVVRPVDAAVVRPDADDPATDYGAVAAGFVSVTPVRLDLTARDLLDEVGGYVPEV